MLCLSVKNKKAAILLSLIFILGLSLRLAYVLFMPQIGVNRGDSARYALTTANLLEGKGYSYTDEKPDLFLAPGYPFFLALVYKVFGVHNYTAVRIVQSVLSAFVILFIYYLAKKIFNRKSAILSAFIASIYPGFIGYSGLFLPQAIVVFLILLFLVILLGRTKNFYWGCLLGLIAGYSCLTRPEFLLFWLILCTVIFLTDKEKKHNLRFISVILIVMFSVIMPWTVRNYKVSGRPVLITVHYGDLLWYSTWKGEWLEYKSEPPYTTIAVGLGPVDAANAYAKAGIQNVKEHPYIYIKLCVKRFFRLWLTGHSNIFNFMSKSMLTYLAEKNYFILFIKAVMLILNTVLVLIGFFSAAFLYKRINNKQISFYTLYYPIAFFSILHFFLFATPRYAIPAMPSLIMLASFGIISLIEDRNKGLNETHTFQ